MEFQRIIDNKENSRKIQIELQKLKSVDMGEIFNKFKEDIISLFGQKYVLYKKDEITVTNLKKNKSMDKIKELIIHYTEKYNIIDIVAFKIIEKEDLIIIKRKR